MIGATMWHGPHQVAQKSTTASPTCCSTSATNVASVTAARCFTSSITLHAPSIEVSLTFYEPVSGSRRHRSHQHHRGTHLLSRRLGSYSGEARNRRWHHDRQPAFRRRRRRAARAERSQESRGEVPCETRARHPPRLLPRVRRSEEHTSELQS